MSMTGFAALVTTLLVAAAPRSAPMRAHVPAAGQANLIAFTLTFHVKKGAHPPHALRPVAVSRTKLPRGVAVVAETRLLKHSKPGTATYVGVLALFRSKSVRELARMGRASDDWVDIVRWVFGIDLRGYPGYSSSELRGLLDPGTAETSEEQKLMEEFKSDSFADGHAYSWSSDKAPAQSANGDTVISDISDALATDSITDSIVSDIELALDAQFDHDFPDGSLDEPAAKPPAGDCTFVLNNAPATDASAVQVTCATTAWDAMSFTFPKHSVTLGGSSMTPPGATAKCAQQVGHSDTIMCTRTPAKPGSLTLEIYYALADPANQAHSACNVHASVTVSKGGTVVGSSADVPYGEIQGLGYGKPC